MKSIIIKVATFLAGLYFFLEFILPEKINLADGSVFEFAKYHEQVTLALIAMANVSIALGLVNLLLGHGSRLIFLKSSWVNSLALLSGLFLMIFFSVLEWRDASSLNSEISKITLLRDFSLRIESDKLGQTKADINAPLLEERNKILLAAVAAELKPVDGAVKIPDALFLAEDSLRKDLLSYNLSPESFEQYKKLASSLSEISTLRREVLMSKNSAWYQGMHALLFQGLFVSLGSAMFSLLGFYIASASYRAFRIRNFDSSLLMISALLVILGQVPFMLYGQSELGMSIFVSIQRIRLWLLSVPSTAAFRAIEIGTAVAALIMSFRIWLSIDSKNYQ